MLEVGLEKLTGEKGRTTNNSSSNNNNERSYNSIFSMSSSTTNMRNKSKKGKFKDPKRQTHKKLM